ncbi:DUF2336 domain-containing protein [Pannonibacter sp.]|uniref:DUF2336 domain-containing protein n=1 Tax=Pannonibacter sp. TaxID=1906786 RepID=UPI003F7174DE
MSPVPFVKGLDRPALDPEIIRKDRLLLAAAELFCARERHDRAEVRAFAELALNLYDATSLADRRRVACLVARAPQAPADVLTRFADDEDALVAYPVILHGAAIAPDVLARIARRGPESLRRALLRRQDLDEATLVILAAEAEPDTLLALSDLPDGNLPDACLDILCGRPAVMDRLGPLLAERNALPSDLLMANFPTLDPVNRQRALATAGLRALAEKARQPLARPARPTLKPQLLKRLIEVALGAGHEAFATELAQLLGLDGDFCLAIVCDMSGESLMVALKALGMAEADASSILVRLTGNNLSLEGLRAALRLYETLSLAAAQLLVSTWRQHSGTEPGQQRAAASTSAPVAGLRPGAQSGLAAGLRGSDASHLPLDGLSDKRLASS